MLRQALSLCSSMVEEKLRIEAAFFESVRVLVMRLMNQGGDKKISLPEMNARINELLKASIKSDGVINLFSDVSEGFSLFDPKFLEEISKMKEKNLDVELLKKLIAEQVHIYRHTNVVKSEKFSEIMQSAMNRYLNGMLTNEQVIEELYIDDYMKKKVVDLFVHRSPGEWIDEYENSKEFLNNYNDYYDDDDGENENGKEQQK